MPDAFLSYAHEDRQIAERLQSELTRAGLKIWMDTRDLLPGERWKTSIRRAIRQSTFFLALMSSQSLSKRGFVQKELRLALEVMDELPPDKPFLIPIRIDSCEPTDERILEVQWVDLFPSWELAISKLLTVFKLPRQSIATGTDRSSFTHCEFCGSVISEWATRCGVCGSDVGAPNVRRAMAQRNVLDARYKDAVEEADKGGCLSLVRELEERVKASQAVISTNLMFLIGWLEKRGYSIYALEKATQETPSDAYSDKVRRSIEGALFGSTSEHIRYAVLSTTGRGLESYGSVWLALKNVSVEQRATVLEKNSYDFVSEHLLSGELPKGFVSIWSDRHKLAVAKLVPSICKRGRPTNQEWLLEEETKRTDFMEVHIYGPIDVLSLESITLDARTTSRADQGLINYARALAAERGIKFTILK